MFINQHAEGVDNWKDAERYLDAQREKVLPQFEYLKSLLIGYRNAKGVLASFLMSAGAAALLGLEYDD